MTNTACVLRDLGDGTGKQYVPLSEVASVCRDETAFVGSFQFTVERHGPSGSHERNVGTPVGKLTEVPAEQAVAWLPVQNALCKCGN